MKILVPIENDMIYQHFGHTPALRLYDVEGNTVLHTKDYVPNGHGHVVMCQIALELGVNVVIAGCILDCTVNTAFVLIFGGVSGRADDAVLAYLEGTLTYNPDIAKHHCGCHH